MSVVIYGASEIYTLDLGTKLCSPPRRSQRPITSRATIYKYVIILIKIPVNI